MIRRFILPIVAAVVLTLSSCHRIESYDNDMAGNFDALWTLFDEHYCFFRQKGVDWDAVYKEYRPRVESCRTTQEFFRLCAEMLDELKDGHVNLSSWFETSYYKAWWSDYPQNYDARVVEENYLNFNYKQVGGVMYGILPQNVGYVRVASFAAGIGESNLDAVIDYMRLCEGMIIDVRDNGGGNMTNVEKLVSRFITERTLAGYISHKTGPGHDDFSEPYAYYYAPPEGRKVWTRRVAVLANRSTFSAANNFVSVMKLLPQVTVIGARTGGGSGMPLSYELPCGWSVRMSAAPVTDALGRDTEFGVEPTDGYAMNISAEQTAAGIDPMIDTAVDLLTDGKGGEIE